MNCEQQPFLKGWAQFNLPHSAQLLPGKGSKEIILIETVCPKWAMLKDLGYSCEITNHN